MKRLLIAILALVCLLPAARAQQRTLISDALTTPAGGGFVGTITITTAQTFISADGFTIAGGAKVYVTTGQSGQFSVSLVPNIGGSPSGSTYSVDYQSATVRFHEIWVIPQSATQVTLSQVRVIWPQAPNVTIPAAQFAPPQGCISNLVLRWTIAGWICATDNIGMVTLNLENPSTTDTGTFQWKPKNSLVLTRITCNTDQGSAAINFDLRTEASPNIPGAPVLQAALPCNSTGVFTTAFATSSIPGLTPAALDVVSVSGSPRVIRIHLEYQLQ